MLFHQQAIFIWSFQQGSSLHPACHPLNRNREYFNHHVLFACHKDKYHNIIPVAPSMIILSAGVNFCNDNAFNPYKTLSPPSIVNKLLILRSTGRLSCNVPFFCMKLLTFEQWQVWMMKSWHRKCRASKGIPGVDWVRSHDNYTESSSQLNLQLEGELFDVSWIWSLAC
jgi:hypothetical protein